MSLLGRIRVETAREVRRLRTHSRITADLLRFVWLIILLLSGYYGSYIFNSKMGSCCSGCLRSKSSESETEMTEQGNGSKIPSNPSSISLSSKMSAPTIQTNQCNLISGMGLALIDVSIEQDAAYWEWHIETLTNEDNEDEDDFDSFTSLKFGVATKKNANFYKALAFNEDDSEFYLFICRFIF